MQCCSGAGYVAAERQFGPDIAQRDIRRYHRKGPDAATRVLLAAVREVMPAGGSLLDIGAGVGIVSFELLSGGLRRATLVEASPSYLDAARKEAERRLCADRMRFIAGDFTSLASGIDAADVVTMHRVICCYPRYASLLSTAANRTRRLFAFSYPRDRWYLRAWLALENGRRRLCRNSFRTFVHSPAAMEAVLVAAGFQRVRRRNTVVWCVDVYSRAVSANN
jgi:SAM-dependent methyltransferase